MGPRFDLREHARELAAVARSLRPPPHEATPDVLKRYRQTEIDRFAIRYQAGDATRAISGQRQETATAAARYPPRKKNPAHTPVCRRKP